jgi:hypothetical protein
MDVVEKLKDERYTHYIALRLEAAAEITRLRQDLSTAIERAAVIAEACAGLIEERRIEYNEEMGVSKDLGADQYCEPIFNHYDLIDECVRIASSIRSLKTESSNG